MSHTLSNREIMSIPIGRIMDTFIEEYVNGEHSIRWNNSQQEELRCHWFEEHPRVSAEDDGGYCNADGLPRYSTDISIAMSLFQNRNLSTITEPPTTNFPAMENRHWATFSLLSLEEDRKLAECNRKWAKAETIAMAICRAALLATRN